MINMKVIIDIGFNMEIYLHGFTEKTVILLIQIKGTLNLCYRPFFRSSRPEVLLKKVFLEISQNSQVTPVPDSDNIKMS